MTNATPDAPMTTRARVEAILHYQPYDRLPLVHFGFWRETLGRWAAEGHLPADLAAAWIDGNEADREIGRRLSFDCNWQPAFMPDSYLRPFFDERVIRELPDGTQHRLNREGVVVTARPEAGSIPGEIAHTLVDRASWEEHYRWRFEFAPARVDEAVATFAGGLAALQATDRERPLGLFCGSLYGRVRNILGVEGSCYLMMDDEALFDEIIDTAARLCYQVTEASLATGARFDYAHFWEDICFKNGPLIAPTVFAAKVGPHYRRITELVGRHGIDIVSLDCDGCIDALIPTWIDNGVNTMFPIEVGTWRASIAPWREQYGRDLRGVGGMNKVVFSRDRAAVDAEIERLRPLVDLGGFIPCPDHRIAPDARWDLVCYYCERMRAVFG